MGAEKERTERFDHHGTDIPVSVTIDDNKTPTPNHVTSFLNSLCREDGSLDENSPIISPLIKFAKEKGFDVLAKANGTNITAILGKWIGENPKLVKIGTVVLTTSIVAGAAGFLLYKHHRESSEQK